jgi:transposase
MPRRIDKPKTSGGEEKCSCAACPYKKKVLLLELMLQEMRERYWGRKKRQKEPGEEVEVVPKKRGAPVGHPGWFRKIGEKIDEFVEVTLQRCPHCGSRKLTRCKEMEEHIQEDIVLPQLKVTCFRHHTYWCSGCKRKVEPPPPSEELPKSYIGPVAKSLAVWLKYDVKISDRDLKRVFETLFHLKIVPASVAGFRDQLARRGISLYQKIQEALQRSDYAHSDETGWRVGRENRWLWSVSTKALSLFHIDKSRGLKVLQGILGPRFPGILIVDFLSVYSRYEAKAIQRCLVHLLREIRKILKVWGEDPSVARYLERLKDWIRQARDLAKNYRLGRISFRRFKKQRQALKNALSDFDFVPPNKKPLERIKKRLSRHNKELLTFLDHPRVDSDNNHAERQIRPNVLLRKITFGNDSDKGAANHGILMSIIQTARQNGRSPPEALHRIITAKKKKPALTWLGVAG